MGHFNYVSQNKISSFVVINLLGKLPQILAGFLFDLSSENGYIEGVKVEVLNERGDQNGFDSLLRINVLF